MMCWTKLQSIESIRKQQYSVIISAMHPDINLSPVSCSDVQSRQYLCFNNCETMPYNTYNTTAINNFLNLLILNTFDPIA